jgi:hypothetical protein
VNFLLILDTKLKIIKSSPQEVKTSQSFQQDKLNMLIISEKDIYKTNKLQKVLMPLMAMCTKLPTKVAEL